MNAPAATIPPTPHLTRAEICAALYPFTAWHKNPAVLLGLYTPGQLERASERATKKLDPICPLPSTPANLDEAIAIQCNAQADIARQQAPAALVAQLAAGASLAPTDSTPPARKKPAPFAPPPALANTATAETVVAFAEQYARGVTAGTLTGAEVVDVVRAMRGDKGAEAATLFVLHLRASLTPAALDTLAQYLTGAL